MIPNVEWQRNKFSFWVVTHVLAFAAGWTLVSMPGNHQTAGTPNVSASASIRKTKVTRQREQLDRSNAAGSLVWNLLEQMDEAQSQEELPPAKDRAAAARAAIDAWVGDGKDPKLLSEAKARFSHWLQTDPKAALTYWNGSGNPGVPSLSQLDGVARPYLETISLGELQQWFQDPQGLLTGAARAVMFDVFSRMIASNQELAILESVFAEMSSDISNRLVRQTIDAWPQSGMASIEAFVRENPNPQTLHAFLNRLEAANRLEWIQRELRDEGRLSEVLRESGLSGSIVFGATGASTLERVSLLDELNGNSSRSSVSAANLARGDVLRWLAAADGETEGLMSDWKHRLRMGEISARQVLDEARRTLPAIAADQPDEFRMVLFGQLSAIHPASAMDLISDLPLKEREAAMLDAAMGVAGQADPQHLVELLSQMPPTLSSKPNDRFQVWIRAAAPSYKKYGESYSAWVMAMPHGIERDWALSGLYSNFLAYDPEKARFFSSLKTLPPGWKPAQ